MKSSDQLSEIQSEYYYLEDGFVVFTARFLSERGYCCGNGCRHCPYTPRHGGKLARLL
ncbi:MAG: hypothetical protein IPM42_15755 [Saprospiraceae bacterium]|nr:hypothetical protein [Saprospiraceae bacterium]